jgi:D-alanyl-lipoteichoic acid acyltransferase DltB (MBOAT superfamily)
MSFCFYAYGEPKFVFIMVLSIGVNWIIGLGLESRRENRRTAKAILFFMAVFNIGLLFIFKYLNFAILNLDRLPGFDLPQTTVVLPIGISFFTFQAMSYCIDVYRGSAQAQKNLFQTALYIAFFPALIAGPIIRYKSIADQLAARSTSLEDFVQGLKRFIIGLAKKLILANTVAACADLIFGPVYSDHLSVLAAWLGAACYTLQIYFDFSGYSDMAIGLGRMFGFRLDENFNHPYISGSVTEFWRRWHISLSSWFRDYVYIPLGGSRVPKVRLVFNLFITWMLTGIWHGASWTFVLWGFFYFVLLTFEKLAGIPQKTKEHPVFGGLYRVFTILCFVVGWVVFRSDGFGQATLYLKTMFGLSAGQGSVLLFDSDSLYLLSQYAVVLAIAVFLSTPALQRLTARIGDGARRLSVAVYLALFVLDLSFMASSQYNPFIYFNF